MAFGMQYIESGEPPETVEVQRFLVDYLFPAIEVGDGRLTTNVPTIFLAYLAHRVHLGHALAESLVAGRVEWEAGIAPRPVSSIWMDLKEHWPCWHHEDFFAAHLWLVARQNQLGLETTQEDVPPPPVEGEFPRSVNDPCFEGYDAGFERLVRMCEALNQPSISPRQELPAPAEPAIPVTRVVAGLPWVVKESHFQVTEVEELRQRLLRYQDKARSGALIQDLKDRLAHGLPGLAFDLGRTGQDHKVVFVSEQEMPKGDLWFIGDVHGDFVTLQAVLDVIDQHPRIDGEPPCLVFLGDLIDRGPHSFEVLLAIIELIQKRPLGVCLLSGNHDEALAFSEDGFASSVYSSVGTEFKDSLNAHSNDPVWTELGQTFMALSERLPRALFLHGGLFAAHAGFPHSDLQADLRTGARSLQHPDCLQDFNWLRLSSAKKKFPDRSERGCHFGWQNFDAFCGCIEDQFPVRAMVRGHDHQEEGYLVTEKPAVPIVTITTLSSLSDPYSKTPCTMRWGKDGLLEIHQVRIDPALLQAFEPPDDDGNCYRILPQGSFGGHTHSHSTPHDAGPYCSLLAARTYTSDGPLFVGLGTAPLS